MIKARFNDPDDPLTFLIVTAKLLTGFDAPIEQVMYLDRPLRRHTLFQAITRTNRRYTNPVTGQEKHYGLIVDYIGLGNQIARALKAADPDRHRQAPGRRGRLWPPSSMRRSPDRLQRFDGHRPHRLLLRRPCKPRWNASTTQDGQGRVRAETSQPSQTLWEFLDPHAVTLDAHRADYKWLAQVYEAHPARPSRPTTLLWDRLGAKTLATGARAHVQRPGHRHRAWKKSSSIPTRSRRCANLVEQGELDLDPDRDLLNDPVTLDEVLTAIDRAHPAAG
ncbi:MAG: hypothetical protein V9G09_11225 [Candidatus Nanopelagicales bacterium]